MFKLGFFIFIVMTNSFSMTIAHTRAVYAEREDSAEDSKESNENHVFINNEMQTFPKTIPSTIVSFREINQQHSADGSDNVGVEVSTYGMEESNKRTGSRGKTSSNTNKSSTNRDNQNSKSFANNKTKNSEISVSRAQNQDTMNNAKPHRTKESERSSYQATSDFLMPSNDKRVEENSPKKNVNFDRILDLEEKNPSRFSNSFHGTTDLHMPSIDKTVKGSFAMKNTNAEHGSRIVLDQKNSSRLSNSFLGKTDLHMPSNGKIVEGSSPMKNTNAEHGGRIVLDQKNSSRLSNSFLGKTDLHMPSNGKTVEGSFPMKNTNAEHGGRIVLDQKNSSRLSNSFLGTTDLHMPSNGKIVEGSFPMKSTNAEHGGGIVLDQKNSSRLSNSIKKNENFDRVLDLEDKNPSRLSNSFRGTTDLHMPSNDKIVEGSFPMKNTNAEHGGRIVLDQKNSSRLSNSFLGTTDLHMPSNGKIVEGSFPMKNTNAEHGGRIVLDQKNSSRLSNSIKKNENFDRVLDLEEKNPSLLSNSFRGTTDLHMPSNGKIVEGSFPMKNTNAEHGGRIVLDQKNSSRLSNSFLGTTDLHMPSNGKIVEGSFPMKNTNAEHGGRIVLDQKNSSRLSNSFLGTTDLHMPSNGKIVEGSFPMKNTNAEHGGRIVLDQKNSSRLSNSIKKNENFDRVLDLEEKNPSRLSNSFRGTTDLHMPSNDKIVEGSFPMKNTNAEHGGRIVLDQKNSSRLSNSFHGSANFLMPISNKTSSDVNESTDNNNTLSPHQNRTFYNRKDEKVVLKAQQTSNKKSTGFVNDANLISKGSLISKQDNQDNSLVKKSINSNHNIVNHSADKEMQSKTVNSIRKTETGQRTKQRLCEQKYMEYMERIFDDNDTIWDGSDMEFDGRVLAEPGEYPHMTALGFEEPNQPIDYKCGGSLISEHFVLTAAHCTNLTGETPTKVRIGDLNLMVEEHYLEPQIRNISRIFMHPQYLSSLYYNDIALLEMEEPVEFTEFVRPIRLWTDKKSLDNITAHAMGYGATAFGKARTNRLTDMNLTIVPNDICNRELPEMPEAPLGVVSQQICARDYLMNRDTCQGDSGGPLQLNVRGRRQRNHYHLIGITSFGLFCRSSYPSVYTRVSKFLDWIEQIVWR